MAKGSKSKQRGYKGKRLAHVAFPLGGMGAGMVCLEGAGAFSHVSLRHKPDLFHEPLMFAGLYVKGAKTARVIEGPVPMHKVASGPRSGLGKGIKNFGLARFSEARFDCAFPFGKVSLADEEMPVEVELTGWSPFAPPDADSASLPVAGLEYKIKNTSAKLVKGVFSFHAKNFMKPGLHVPANVSPVPGGFMLDVPAGAALPHVASWWVSRIFDRTTPVTQAPCVKLADAAGWEPAPMLQYFANAHARYATSDGLVYLGTKLKAAQAGTWEFRVGHDGPARMFVNGVPVYAEGNRANPHKPDRARVDVTLEAGEHEVMFAFDLCGGGGWGVSLALAPAKTQEMAVPLPQPDAWTPTPVSHEGSFAAFVDDEQVSVDCAWMRGSWFDSVTTVWNHVMAGRTPAATGHADGEPSDGGSLYVPFAIKPGSEKTVRLRLAWYVPKSDVTSGGRPDAKPAGPTTYVPWYATRFKSIGEVMDYWRQEYDSLRARSAAFSECFYDTTLPKEAVEAAAANMTILKSTTVLRQHDGRFWGWEGSADANGSCAGSCTHVWNYAQALCHLFPSMERSLRETEFLESQDETGHQNFRAALPIGPTSHQFHAAADGQLGGVVKAYREWRISGDTAWMLKLWPRIKASLDYCIATWDPDGTGTVVEPHHNTYDIEFWGADAMCTGFYLSALAAATAMGKAANDDVSRYQELLARGKAVMEKVLWNGDYFTQKVQWKGLRADDPAKALSVNTSYSPESLAILEKEGPKYQYGKGCLSDGVIGDWLARLSGLPTVLDEEKVAKHVTSVFTHNFKPSLKDHSNPQRPGYALAHEAGLLLCSWPKGGKPSFPFVYSDEVWTGIEYQVAGHLIMVGKVKDGLTIVRAARKRYNGRYRNPFNEFECGNWYARAMSSYGLLQALSGARYDAVTQTLRMEPQVKGDFRAFISTATGFGTVGVRRGRAFLKVMQGEIPVRWLVYVRK